MAGSKNYKFTAILIILALVFVVSCSREQQSQQSSVSPAAVPAPATSASPGQSAQPTAVAPQQAVPATAGPQNFSQIQVGMSSQQVVQLLGNPSRAKQEYQTTEWEYYMPQGGKVEVHLQNDKVVSMRQH